MFAVIDQPLHVLLRNRFATFRKIHLTTAGALRTAGFGPLPTGLAPHLTVRLEGVEEDELQRLLAVLGPARDDHQHGK